MRIHFLLEWLDLALRWAHVFAGILWIGSTYYFTWLDRRLNEDLEGVWMVHSGGFYVVQKQKPAALPRRLHWFRFEALFTWLTYAYLYRTDIKGYLKTIQHGTRALDISCC